MSQAVVYTSPFVPVEWIVAHGLKAVRAIPDCDGSSPAPAGACPFAMGFAEAAVKDHAAEAVVMTSTCDQMRRAAEWVGRDGANVFLLNVPATWESQTARRLYIDELHRLGRFLVRLGGAAPTLEHLGRVMMEHEDRRLRAAAERAPAPRGIPIALVGGPLRPRDRWIFELIEELGGCVALDATETGERCQPARFDPQRLRDDPLEELARAYFEAIPDAFRRPDTQLHEYLARMLPERKVRGILLVRYLWCDQWHAQLPRLREMSSMPVVQIDLGGQDSHLQRTRTRIEALVSILQ